ncbi:hypothetical protein LJR230_001105 [Trinickia sp. LjRoot230]
MQKCDNPRCPICYPNWKEEEAAAKKRAEDNKQDCIDCWRFYQKKAEAIVSAGDPVARSRSINAAYAQLWLDDRRFQWAGLAAFASKQVGCGPLNAAEMIGKSNQQRNAYQQWDKNSSPLERLSPYASPRMPMPDQASGEGARKVYEMLAKGNTALFLDVWPLHMFYKKFGLPRFKRCLPERQALRGSVVWPFRSVLCSPVSCARSRQLTQGTRLEVSNFWPNTNNSISCNQPCTTVRRLPC